jgi:glutamate dehydrogenase (NAD(P)+)
VSGTEVTAEQQPLEWETPLFHQALSQFQQAVPYAEVSDAVVDRLSLPERSLIVSVPIELDDGRRAVFPGYRVQHSSVLGPTKGGVRYDPHVSLGECAALSMWMTWKCALLRLPYGGAKGGIRCDPRAMSLRELQAVTRRFTAELLPVIGPQEDIPAPDMATDEQTMAWMMDTYSMQIGHAVPEIVTGKPISIGGSVFRAEATGAGVVMVVERACERLGWDLAGLRCVVQGFGKVGAVAANELHERGAVVTAVSDVSGGLHDPSGLDIPTLYANALEYGHAPLAEQEGEHLTNEELLELPCDVLVLAALEEQVTGDNAPRVKARMVAEGANGPTTLEGDAILADRGIPVLPDILANAGGVTVSYFEWVQDLGRLFWDRDEIRSRLADKMGDAFDRVWDLAQGRDLTLRQAALVTGIHEVAAALNDRGLYP